MCPRQVHFNVQFPFFQGIGRGLEGNHSVLGACLNLHRKHAGCLARPRDDEITHRSRACIVGVIVGDVQTF